MFFCCLLRFLCVRNISCNPYKSAKVAKYQGKVALTSRAPAGFAYYLVYRAAGEVWDFPVLVNLLCNETDEFLAVLDRVVHRFLHIELVTVALYPRA